MKGTAQEALLEPVIDRGSVAVAELFRAFEPYLRALVRRSLPNRLRGKFDSTDVVQSAWVHVLSGLQKGGWQFADVAGLRALLATVARRRLISRLRHFQPLTDREELGADPGQFPAVNEARPSQIVEAAELWERMLALCPPDRHEVLMLRRRGFRLEEIAERTGLHEGSVRRILRRVASELVLQVDPSASAGAKTSET